MNLSPERIEELKVQFPPQYPIAKESEMLGVADIDWSNLSHKELTCKNHPFSRYLSKDPFSRDLHFIQGPNGLISTIDEECPCPFSDMRVVQRESDV